MAFVSEVHHRLKSIDSWWRKKNRDKIKFLTELSLKADLNTSHYDNLSQSFMVSNDYANNQSSTDLYRSQDVNRKSLTPCILNQPGHLKEAAQSYE